MIGATTIAEYRKYIEKDAALERRFQPVSVDEPAEEEAIRILEGIKGKYEEHHKVTITPEAVDAAVRLSNRYINDRNLPDKAIDLIDEAAASARLRAVDMPDKQKAVLDEIKKMAQQIERSIRMEAFSQAVEIKRSQDELVKKYQRTKKRTESQEGNKKYTIGEDEIAEVVAMWTKIPVQKLAQKESERLLKLEGIDCATVSTPDHIWTVATLDGQEYHIDATWGDRTGAIAYRYFAMTEADALARFQ